MCCEICPRYASCEEEGNLNELCCVSCKERVSCRKEGGSRNKDLSDESEDEFG